MCIIWEGVQSHTPSAGQGTPSTWDRLFCLLYNLGSLQAYVTQSILTADCEGSMESQPRTSLGFQLCCCNPFQHPPTLPFLTLGMVGPCRHLSPTLPQEGQMPFPSACHVPTHPLLLPLLPCSQTPVSLSPAFPGVFSPVWFSAPLLAESHCPLHEACAPSLHVARHGALMSIPLGLPLFCLPSFPQA